MMQYCLDTNTCIDVLRGRHASLMDRFKSKRPADIAVSTMVRAELLYGAMRSAHPKKTRSMVELFLQPYEMISFDKPSADDYAVMRAELEKRGAVIGPNDLVIAATARSRGLILVTHNTREFKRIPGLRLEDWL